MKNTKNGSMTGIFLDVISGIGLIFQAALVLSIWNVLPSIIPVHFDLVGNPDVYGSKSDLLLLLGLSSGSFIGLTWLARFPEKFNYPWTITSENAEYQYQLASIFIGVIKLQLVWMFGFISWRTIKISTSDATNLGSFLVPIILTMSGASIVIYFILASQSGKSKRS